jgi:hypothetical protein
VRVCLLFLILFFLGNFTKPLLTSTRFETTPQSLKTHNFTHQSLNLLQYLLQCTPLLGFVVKSDGKMGEMTIMPLKVL